MTRAGDLDRRITIEQNTTGRTATGAESEGWATLATVWANVRPVRGDESFAAGADSAAATVVFKIRHRTDVTTKMRISYGGDLYDIAALAELGRKDALEITAVARGV